MGRTIICTTGHSNRQQQILMHPADARIRSGANASTQPVTTQTACMNRRDAIEPDPKMLCCSQRVSIVFSVYQHPKQLKCMPDLMVNK
jgi:hypothetical protein